jgi:hypothetical protein
MLYDYLKITEGLLRDRSQRQMNTEDLVFYINRARRDLALRTQSIRRLPPVSGSVLTIEVTAGGSGYTNPQVVISGPDFPSGTVPFPGGSQATGLAQQIGGQIASISVSYGGYGYFQPSVSFTDPTGSGATAVATVSPILTVNPFQEIYNFSDFPLTTLPGIRSVYAIFSGSIIFNNFRYTLLNYPWSMYQSLVRSYPQQYFYVPTVMAQYGQGAGGSMYLYPLPNALYQWEVDCLCLPSELEDDEDFEALPEPWTDAVPFYAAWLSFLEIQNFNSARAMFDMYKEVTSRYSSGARPRLLVNPYGRL